MGRDGWGRVEEGAQGQATGRQRPRPRQVVQQVTAGGDAVDHHRSDRFDDRRFEGGLVAGFDVDQVEQGAHDALDARRAGRCRPDPWPRRRPWPGPRPGRSTSGDRRLPRRPRFAAASAFSAARRSPSAWSRAADQLRLGRRQPGQLHSRPARPRPRRGRSPGVEAARAGARAGPGRPGPGRGSTASAPSSPRASAAACCGWTVRPGRPGPGPAPPRPGQLLEAGGHGGGRRLHVGQLGPKASGVVVEGGDEGGVDAHGQVARDRPPTLGHHRHQAPGALPQRLQPATDVAQSGPAQLRHPGLGRRHRRSRHLQLDLDPGLVAAERRARTCTAASWRAVSTASFPAPQEDPQRVQLGHQVAVAAGGLGLALQGPQLAPDLPQQVGEAEQVGLRPLQPPLRLLLAAAVLEDARRLLHDEPAVLGPGVEDGVEVALGHDDVLLAAHAGVGEQLLEVEQPAGDAVERVLALPRRAEQRAGDGDLGEVDRQHAPGVVDGEADLGPAQRRTAAGAGEDDVVHLGGAHRAGPLGAQHPRHRVDHVRLPAAVRADDDRQPRLELESGRLGEGLEALQGERTKKHRCPEGSWSPIRSPDPAADSGPSLRRRLGRRTDMQAPKAPVRLSERRAARRRRTRFGL